MLKARDFLVIRPMVISALSVPSSVSACTGGISTARPGSIESWIDGRIMLMCRSCSEKPDALARLEEIAAVEWN